MLDAVDLTIPPGTIVGIIGPNGAGKSTLLKAVLRLTPWSNGSVLLDGQPVEHHRDRVAYVPQREAVDWTFPITAGETVMMGRYRHLGWVRRPGDGDRRAVAEALARLRLEDIAGEQIGELSGGQQQRVFLARALVQEAQVYFMDEPFQGVDATTERAIVTLLQELRAAGKTVVVVHHDLQTVPEYFDW